MQTTPGSPYRASKRTVDPEWQADVSVSAETSLKRGQKTRLLVQLDMPVSRGQVSFWENLGIS